MKALFCEKKAFWRAARRKRYWESETEKAEKNTAKYGKVWYDKLEVIGMNEQSSEREIIEEAAPEEQKAPFVPSSKGKRVLAWVLFVIVVLGIITWLLNMAFPAWIDAVKAWLAGLFS